MAVSFLCMTKSTTNKKKIKKKINKVFPSGSSWSKKHQASFWSKQSLLCAPACPTPLSLHFVELHQALTSSLNTPVFSRVWASLLPLPTLTYSSFRLGHSCLPDPGQVFPLCRLPGHPLLLSPIECVELFWKLPGGREWPPTLPVCPVDWQATVHGVTKSWTRLRN